MDKIERAHARSKQSRRNRFGLGLDDGRKVIGQPTGERDPLIVLAMDLS